jgi:hypothetical protein
LSGGYWVWRRLVVLMAPTAHVSKALRALLPHAKREQRDRDGFNSLMHAVQNRNEEALALLLRDASEKEINARKAGGKSARELAEEVQKQGFGFGVPGVSERPFTPHDLIDARWEAI